MKYLLLLILFIFQSCASYVNSLHRQISAAERNQQTRRYEQQFEKRSNGDRRPIRNPRTLQGSVPNSSNTSNMMPQNSRNYGNNSRYTANDFIDKDQSGSLWKEKNSDSFLFISNTNKKEGDIVIVEVMSKLKQDITSELKRAFPPPPLRKKKDESKKEEEPSENDPSKIYDKISTQVVENINRDYLLIRGRKEVLFRKRKRFVELSAVVSTKDIRDDNTVSSLKLLEPKINVLRY